MIMYRGLEAKPRAVSLLALVGGEWSVHTAATLSQPPIPIESEAGWATEPVWIQ